MSGSSSLKSHLPSAPFPTTPPYPAKARSKRQRVMTSLAGTTSSGECGRWAAEVRDPTRGKRVYLGTYDTPEEAAAVYDEAAVILKGRAAVINLPPKVDVTEAVEVDGEEGVKSVEASSPTSVLFKSEEATPFDDFSDGDVDVFGFDIETLCGVPGSSVLESRSERN